MKNNQLFKQFIAEAETGLRVGLPRWVSYKCLSERKTYSLMTQEIYIHAKVPQDKTSEFIQMCNYTFASIGSTINYIKTEQYWKDPLCNTIYISYYTDQKLTFDNWKLILKGLISTEPEILFDNNEELELGSYPLLGIDSIWFDCIIPKSCIKN